MRMRFDSFYGDDDDAFSATRDRLLTEFDQWLEGNDYIDDGEMTAHAGTLLDWRFSYSSGELDTYGNGDIAEFLLEWCPRKVSAPPESALDYSRAVGMFAQFLADTGRLVGGHDRADQLVTLTEELAPSAVQAMGDTSKFGMAKSMFSGGALGDLSELAAIDDPATLQSILDQRMAEFNALPFEERRQLTDRFIEPQVPEPFELPFVYVPPPAAAVAAAAASAPMLAKIAGLRDYLGTSGKALTQKGHLKLADGRALVELLATGDPVDAVHGEHTFKTTSTDNLPKLRLIVALAKEASAVRVHKGALVPVKAWDRHSDVERLHDVVTFALDEGPLTLMYRGGHFGYDPVAELLDDGVVHWMTMVLAAGELPFDELATVLQQSAALEIPPLGAYLTRDSIGETVANNLARTLRLLDELGLLVWLEPETTTSEFGAVRESGGTVSITAFGRSMIAELAPTVGYRLRTIDGIADADATTLLRHLLDTDVSSDDLIAAWQPTLAPSERAALVARAIGVETSGAARIAGLGLLEDFGVETAEPLVRQLLDSPAAGHAATWLLSRGFGDVDSLGDLIGIGVLIDTLSLAVDDPDELSRMFLGSPDPALTLEQMWRHNAPETLAVLDALGNLPDKRVAKLARKAQFKHRSWLANQHN